MSVVVFFFCRVITCNTHYNVYYTIRISIITTVARSISNSSNKQSSHPHSEKWNNEIVAQVPVEERLQKKIYIAVHLKVASVFPRNGELNCYWNEIELTDFGTLHKIRLVGGSFFFPLAMSLIQRKSIKIVCDIVPTDCWDCRTNHYYYYQQQCASTAICVH